MHAFCLSSLESIEGEAIVSIGAGTGYHTALLSKLVGPMGVLSAYEIETRLADRARRNLEDLTNTTVHSSSGVGTRLPTYDVIYVNAGATGPAQRWLDALRIGGRLLFPLTAASKQGAMLLIKRTATDKFEARFVPGCFHTLPWSPR